MQPQRIAIEIDGVRHEYVNDNGTGLVTDGELAPLCVVVEKGRKATLCLARWNSSLNVPLYGYWDRVESATLDIYQIRKVINDLQKALVQAEAHAGAEPSPDGLALLRKSLKRWRAERMTVEWMAHQCGLAPLFVRRELKGVDNG